MPTPSVVLPQFTPSLEPRFTPVGSPLFEPLGGPPLWNPSLIHLCAPAALHRLVYLLRGPLLGSTCVCQPQVDRALHDPLRGPPLRYYPWRIPIWGTSMRQPFVDAPRRTHPVLFLSDSPQVRTTLETPLWRTPSLSPLCGFPSADTSRGAPLGGTHLFPHIGAPPGTTLGYTLGGHPYLAPKVGPL